MFVTTGIVGCGGGSEQGSSEGSACTGRDPSCGAGEDECGLIVKKLAKEVWEVVQKICTGDDRMEAASIQRLMK